MTLAGPSTSAINAGRTTYCLFALTRLPRRPRPEGTPRKRVPPDSLTDLAMALW